MSAPRISFPGPNSEPSGEKLRPAYGDASADGAACARVEYAAERLGAFDAAAVLHFERGFRRYAFQHGEVAGLCGLGAVEIDHVQAAYARLFEAERRFERVAVIGRPAAVVALRQPHAGAADNVRCGYDFYFHRVTVLKSCAGSFRPPNRSFRGGTACRKSCRGPARR